MGLTVAEKIFRLKGDKPNAKPGDSVLLAVDVAMLHEGGTFGLQESFKAFDAERVADSPEFVILLDHFVPASTVAFAQMHKVTREFAKQYGLKNWYEIGRGGICHQLLPEKGFVRPGELITGTDAHTTTYGALGAYPIGVCWTDMAMTLATGKMWAILPESVKITLNGKLRPGVASKDIILQMLKLFGESSLSYKSLEVDGPGVESMTPDERMTICNMSSEMDIKAIIMKPDSQTINYVKARTDKHFEPIWADSDAEYSSLHQIDLNSLEPMVACPHQPGNVKKLAEVEGEKINQAYVGSCTNGRINDLRAAWEILKGHKVHPDVRMIVTPASQDVFLEALDEGLVHNFMDAGAMVTNATCGACIGGHMGLLADGEVCAATSNRNFTGRMGSTKAEVYLLSPAAAAAAAITGELTDPRKYL